MGKTKRGRGGKGRGGRVGGGGWRGCGGGGGGGGGRGRGRGRGRSVESVWREGGRARGHKNTKAYGKWNHKNKSQVQYRPNDNNWPEGEGGCTSRKRHLDVEGSLSSSYDDSKASNIDLKDAPKAVSRSAGVLGNEKIKKRKINDKKDVDYGNDRASPVNNDDIASTILQTLCQKYKGRTQLGYLRERNQLDGIREFDTSESLSSFLKKYDVFEVKEEPNRDAITKKDEVVKDIPEDRWDVIAQLYIQLCLTHSKKSGSCTRDCMGLHICRNFVLSECDRGSKCLFGHDLKTEHNKVVMRRSLLHCFDQESALHQIRDLRYRNDTTLPVICKFYNRIGLRRCRHQEGHGQFLHVCEKYIKGTCAAGFSCNLTHDLEGENPKRILSSYGMAEETTEDIVKALRNVATNANQSRTQKASGDTENNEDTKSSTETNRDELGHHGNQGQTNKEDIVEPEECLTSSAPANWVWSWMKSGEEWTDVADSCALETKFREYIKESENDLDGEASLSFKRVKKSTLVST